MFPGIKRLAMAVSTELKAAITDLVMAEFSDDQICSVIIRNGQDHDGDPILRIHVVYEPKRKNAIPNVDKIVSLPRHIINLLMKSDTEHSDAFPIVSFVSRKDLAKLKLEAA